MAPPGVVGGTRLPRCVGMGGLCLASEVGSWWREKRAYSESWREGGSGGQEPRGSVSAVTGCDPSD